MSYAYQLLAILSCVVSLSFCAQEKELESQQSATAQTTTETALDMTALPSDIQKLVLGYVGSGWQKIESKQYEKPIESLYYLDGKLVGRINQRIIWIYFRQDDRDLSQAELELNKDIGKRLDQSDRTKREQGIMCGGSFSGIFEGSPDSKLFVTSFPDGALYVTNREKNNENRILISAAVGINLINKKMIQSIAFSQDGKYIAIALSKGEVCLYEDQSDLSTITKK